VRGELARPRRAHVDRVEMGGAGGDRAGAAFIIRRASLPARSGHRGLHDLGRPSQA
jgi:hypothetical protein